MKTKPAAKAKRAKPLKTYRIELLEDRDLMTGKVIRPASVEHCQGADVELTEFENGSSVVIITDVDGCVVFMAESFHPIRLKAVTKADTPAVKLAVANAKV